MSARDQADPPPMKTHLAIRGALFAAVLNASPLHAQTKPPPDSTAASSPESPVVLSPFTVNTEKDVGFVATSALAGGRLATPLKDTPVAYSVLTKEFLDAVN